MEKDTIIGWMAFEKNCTMDFTYDKFGGKLIIRPIFSKRRDFKKLFPNSKVSKVCINIKEVSADSSHD